MYLYCNGTFTRCDLSGTMRTHSGVCNRMSTHKQVASTSYDFNLTKTNGGLSSISHTPEYESVESYTTSQRVNVPLSRVQTSKFSMISFYVTSFICSSVRATLTFFSRTSALVQKLAC